MDKNSLYIVDKFMSKVYNIQYYYFVEYICVAFVTIIVYINKTQLFYKTGGDLLYNLISTIIFKKE